MKTKISVLLITSLLFLSGCIKNEIENSNEAIFDYIWTEFDEHYGGFIPRNIDWDAIYATYQPKAVNASSEDELWKVITDMVDELDDQHVGIRNGAIGHASGKIGDELIAELGFDLAIIKSNYLDPNFNIITAGNQEEQVYGTIKNENIGYIYYPNFGFGNGEWFKEIDNILQTLKDTDGLVLDVRNNGGGNPLANRYAASRFMDDRQLAFKIQTKNGPGHNDFDEGFEYYTDKGGDFQYTKPISVLTNHSTVSAGEEFLLFLETQAHALIIGDSTSNAFSTQSTVRFLQNTWQFTFPTQLYSYPDGSSPEGIGIIPDIPLVNQIEDIAMGIDKVLEKGIDELK